MGRAYDVLMVAPTTFFADYGCHVRILEELLALQALGCKSRLCTYAGGRGWPGVTIRRARKLPLHGPPQPGSSRRKFYLDAFLGWRAARELLRQRPDVVHGHLHEGALLGLAVGRLRGVPLVFDFQGSLTAEMIDHGFLRRDSRLYRPWRWIESAINRWADAIITSSRHGADVLVRQFGVPASRITVVVDGVNTERFRPPTPAEAPELARLRVQLGIPPDRQVVVYLGLLAEYQGISHLLRAAQILLRRRPDTHFLIMGYPGEVRYRAMAHELGIADHTSFPGRVAYELAPLHLALGDVAVSAKLSETEANGKLLNYMAMALPTVAFDTSVSREILGDLGLFAPVGDVEALAGRLEEVLADEAAARALGQRLRERAISHFSWRESARAILGVYDRLLGA